MNLTFAHPQSTLLPPHPQVYTMQGIHEYPWFATLSMLWDCLGFLSSPLLLVWTLAEVLGDLST
jgi:hypothetical protein